MSAQDALGRQWKWGVTPIADPAEASRNRRSMNAGFGTLEHWTTHWESAPEHQLDPSTLVVTQADLEREKHDAVRSDPSHEDRPINVVRTWGKDFIYDGHHRADLAREQGRTVRARVYSPRYGNS